jgi:hypothetical protein
MNLRFGLSCVVIVGMDEYRAMSGLCINMEYTKKAWLGQAFLVLCVNY